MLPSPPFSLSVVELPLHMVLDVADIVTTGDGVTVITTESLVAPQAVVISTVYVVVTVGLATGFAIAGLLKLAEGDHE